MQPLKPTKLAAGAVFPKISVTSLSGEKADLAECKAGTDWKLVVVYRGKHCPLCTKYLHELEGHVDALAEIDVDVAAVSADSQSQLETHLEKLDVSFPLYYGLSIEQMQQLGVYISVPRSEQETDHPFAEPGLFVINAQGRLQLVDISNGPFARPELGTLISGLGFIRNPENNYPIRGTYQ